LSSLTVLYYILCIAFHVIYGQVLNGDTKKKKNTKKKKRKTGKKIEKNKCI